ncbi:MAG: hypothetical protein E7329_00980 [Clostridiales bacterium]|nr:hypothetical protein [Clostridiales bacterium]
MEEKGMDMTERLQALATEKTAILQGDAERVAKQHADGKCTARERIGKLYDAGSFMEIDALRKDSNVVAGVGTVNGQAVYTFAQDYAAMGGAMTKEQAAKIMKVLNMAKVTGAPVVALLDSAGAKITEGAAALPMYAEIMGAMARLSGVCPMIACVMGPCKGLATLLTQVADITIQVKKTGEIALHTALVMNSEKGKEKTAQQLFGAETMAKQGAVALTAESEDEATALIAALVDMLPACNMEDAPLAEEDDLNRLLICENPDDAASLMADIADGNRVIELYKEYGTAVKVALCRIGGRTVGVIATDHENDGGRLTACACKKAARFVRLCDCYGLPVVSLINTDGLSVPCECHQAKLIKGAAELLYAYAETTAPKVAIVTGNAVGAAYVAMGGKSVADMCYAWPTAMIAPLTAETAVQTMDADLLLSGEKREDLEEKYAEKCGAIAAAQEGIVDDVIEAKETRKHIIAALELLAAKHDVNLPKKHGNLPL